MPQNQIKQFTIDYLQVLDLDGNADKALHPDISEDKIKEMYHMMVLLRTMDEKLFNLQRSGKIGTYAQVKGEEASEIGSAMALEPQDWVIPSFREMGVLMVRGADRGKLVQGWNGDTRAFAVPEGANMLPPAIPIASQLLHASGIAWASKIRKLNSVSIVYFGDGATSEGDFHEALNFAGVFKLPIIFLCQNNLWAISTPREKQTAAETIAQKAIAYGIHGIQVDGNDILAVYKATKDAADRARKGEGPTLIETMTFRMGDHTTSDDSSKYRSDDLKKEWEPKDPILRLQKYFEKIGTWSEDYGNWVKDTVAKEVEEAVEKGLNVEAPSPYQMFEDVFVEMPKILQEQKEFLEKELEGGDQK